MKPASRLAGVVPYVPSSAGGDVVARLHANEGRAPELDLQEALRGLDLARYPSTAAVEADLARFHGVDAAQVLVTAGADDALARIASATLEPGRRAVMAHPTFEMIPRYARLAEAEVVPVPWLGGLFPLEAFRARLEVGTVAFVVTPSSPSGEVAPLEALLALAEAADGAGAQLVVDLAYVEFADVDPCPELLAQGNVLITRTLSKALGLAGLRIGYVLGPVERIRWLRSSGQPFSVAAPSLAIARALLPRRVELAEAARARVREERSRIFEALERVGAEPVPSQGNFVFARAGGRGIERAAALAKLGFRVRAFAEPPLSGTLRISCPQDETVSAALLEAIEQVWEAA